MLNPWLSLSFQAARLGLKTQSLVVDHLLRIAGTAPANPKPASVSGSIQTASPEEDRSTAEAARSSLVARAQAASNKQPQVSQKVSKIHRKQGGRGKRSRVK
jgi:hypothetical protein